VQSASPGFNPYAPPVASVPPPGGAGEPPRPGSLNVDGAIGRAYDTMRAFLLQPFNLGKWFAFGFIVWLCDLGEGGQGLPTNVFNIPGLGGGSHGGSGPSADFGDLLDWLRDHEATVLGAAVAGGVVVLALGVLFLWLSARGTMMALRAVALNHTRVGEHWNETREAAWSYFGFRMLLAAIGFPALVGTVVWGVYAFFRVPSGADLLDYVWALAPPIGVLLVVSLLLAPIHFLGRNLLAPLLLRFGGGLRANWARTMGIVRTSFGAVVLFLLVRMAIALVQGIAEVIAVYATCCIGAFPVVHQTVVAPFHAFERAYTLRVLESLGPEYKLVADAPWQPPPPAAPPYGQGPYGPAPYPPYPPPR